MILQRELHCCHRCVVLFCPDCATAWNMRKQTLLKSSLSLLRDLQLSRLALRLHPKSTEAFAHRRWILKKLFPAMFSSNLHNAAAPKNTCADSHVRVVQEHLPEHTEHQWHLLHEETKLCEKAAGWHRSNYNAWNHRLWIAKKLAIKPLVHFACENTIAIFVKHLCTELDTTMAWIERNVSDHSGMAFCQQVLCDLAKFCMTENRLSNEDLLASVQTNVLCYWTRALVQCDELLTLHDGRHEALWMHRYELVLSFHQLLAVENTALKCQDETHGNAAKLFSFSKCVSFCKMFTEKNIGDCDGLPACRRHLSFLEKVLPYVVHSRPKNA